jgi:hypothetical protein
MVSLETSKQIDSRPPLPPIGKKSRTTRLFSNSTIMKLKIRRMNDDRKNRNVASHRTLRGSRAAPGPPFVPHNPGAPVSNSLENNSVGNNPLFHSKILENTALRRVPAKLIPRLSFRFPKSRVAAGGPTTENTVQRGQIQIRFLGRSRAVRSQSPFTNTASPKRQKSHL